jgi:hypothetical protein
MDVAISTEGAEANGGFTQDILHIELVGVAEVDPDAGVLNIDAVSMVEPDVLGQEFAHGLLSFQLQSYPDQVNPPDNIVPDTVAPTLQSWTLGIDGATGLDKTLAMKPTDPIILNFDEPLDRATVAGKVHLYKNEGGTPTEMDAKVSVDGAAIVIKPAEPIQHPTEIGPSLEYQVTLDPGITDLAGNEWVGTFDENFALPVQVQLREEMLLASFFDPPFTPSGTQEPVKEKSPFILGLYPGFPCPLNTDTQDLTQNIAGRCAGGMQPHPNDDLGDLEPLTPDDKLPLPVMPANRPIIVVFSEPMDPTSLFDTTGNPITFSVEKVDSLGQPQGTVAGKATLSHNNDTLRFVPDQPWEDGQFYRYTLKSNGSMTSNACTGLCGLDGLPLQTQLLSVVSVHDKVDSELEFGLRFSPYNIWQEQGPSLIGGGPDLTQYFRGAPKTSAVLQLLRLADNFDSNANLVNESNNILVVGDTSPGTSFYNADFWRYATEETGTMDWQSDTVTADLVDEDGRALDPSGVQTPPNSAKILSSFYGYTSWDESRPDYLDGLAPGLSAGSNIGCGYEDFIPWEDQSGCTSENGEFTLDPVTWEISYVCYEGIPVACPESKFSFIHTVLFAEVTDQVENDSLRVHIFPGHIITSSFKIYTKNPTGSSGEVIDSGYQLMRMRYPDGSPTIDAYIQAGENGPELQAEVSLYLDAPYLVQDVVVIKRISSAMHHNFYSYPVSMNLAGPLAFLEDGRMLVEQHNRNAVEFDFRANVPTTLVDLMVPEGGTFLRYISEPIK